MVLPMQASTSHCEVFPAALKLPQHLVVTLSFHKVTNKQRLLLSPFVDEFKHFYHSSIYFCARWCLWKWSRIGIPHEESVEQLWALFSRGEFSFWDCWKCIPPPSLLLLSPPVARGQLFLVFLLRINSSSKYLAANLHGESPHCIRPPCWQRGRGGPSVAVRKGENTHLCLDGWL